MSGLLVRDVLLEGERVDLRCTGGLVEAVGTDLVARPGDTVLRGAAAMLPGLHDHHLHLMAMAAHAGSVQLGTGTVAGPADLARVLRGADRALPAGAWLRAVGYDESTAGPLDHRVLDRLVPGRPVRVQHRAGHLGVLNSAGGDAVGLDGGPEGAVVRDAAGVPTGEVVDADGWLGDRLPRGDTPDLGAVSRRLAARGVTGVTDATPVRRPADLEALAAARRDGRVVQRLTVTGGVELAGDPAPEGVTLGPVKVMVTDDPPPRLAALVDRFAAAHRAGRAVAVHCVTRVAAVVAVAAWEEAGARTGDRMEHGGVLPPDTVARLVAMGITVVTQPAFVLDRGDRYLAEVEVDDLPWLYPCASLLRAGVPVGGSTDAPFGPDDPWVAMAAAVHRRTRTGSPLGPGEAVDPGRALGLFLSDPTAPGGPARRLRPGRPADLCLLDCTLDRALADLDASHVLATVVGGRVVYEVGMAPVR